MALKAILFALLAVGVFADDHKFSSVLQRKQIKTSTAPKCEDFHVGDRFRRFDDTADIIYSCARQEINETTIVGEFEEAKSNGALDKFFKTYCESKPQVQRCAKVLLEQLRPCVQPLYSDSIDVAKKISDAIFDFACKNDGEAITAFITSNGSQCYRNNLHKIAPCVDQKEFPEALESNEISVEEKCVKYDQLSSCLVGVLQSSCDTATPANSFQDLFRAIRKASPCNDL